MDDDKKKLIIATVAAAIVLVITIMLSIKLIKINNNKKKYESVDNANIYTDNNIIEDNTIDNVAEDNNAEEEIDNNTNESDEENFYEIDSDIPESEKEAIQNKLNNEEKAINIAKSNWGEDDTVYFSYEGIEDGKYIVSVTSKKTTYVLTRYYINIEDETFYME